MNENGNLFYSGSRKKLKGNFFYSGSRKILNNVQNNVKCITIIINGKP